MTLTALQTPQNTCAHCKSHAHSQINDLPFKPSCPVAPQMVASVFFLVFFSFFETAAHVSNQPQSCNFFLCVYTSYWLSTLFNKTNHMLFIRNSLGFWLPHAKINIGCFEESRFLSTVKTILPESSLLFRIVRVTKRELRRRRFVHFTWCPPEVSVGTRMVYIRVHTVVRFFATCLTHWNVCFWISEQRLIYFYPCITVQMLWCYAT